MQKRIYFEDFTSSDSEDSDDLLDDKDREAMQEHKLKNIFQPDLRGDKIVLSVIDTGVGIQKEDRLKLFKLFGKISSTRGMNTGGIGLGLVISEQIVKCFDGTIGVRSRFGHGSIFGFSILLDNEEPFE